MTVFYAVLMCLYDVKLTLIVIAIGMLNVAAVSFAGRLRTDASRRLMQDKGKLMGTAMNGLQMIETIKATGSESEFFARWAGYYAKSVNSEQFLQVLGQVAGARAAVRDDAVHGGGAGARRPQGDERRAHRRHARRLPDAARQLHAAADVVRARSARRCRSSQADMNRLDDVLRYPADKQYAQTAPTLEVRPERGQAVGPARAAGHHVRLQPARAAAHRQAST